MPETTQKLELSRSLEDYLATVWKVIRSSAESSAESSTQTSTAETEKSPGYARVKEIAAQRNVKPGSVSPAMAKLAKLNLIVYERRERILLTSKGTEIAEALIRKQTLLNDFFEDILKIPAPQAHEQACAVAHCLSEQSTDRLEDLTQFIRANKSKEIFSPPQPLSDEITISMMRPGQEGVVRLIRARGELHYQLIDMGLLPDSKIKLIGKSHTHLPTYVVALQGFEIKLSDEQARAVVVSL